MMQLSGPPLINGIPYPPADDDQAVDVAVVHERVERTYDSGGREIVRTFRRHRIRWGYRALPPGLGLALRCELSKHPIHIVPRTRVTGDPEGLAEVEYSVRRVSALPLTGLLQEDGLGIAIELEELTAQEVAP